MRMKEVTITPSSVFIGHDYFHRAGGECKGKYCLRYHMHLVQEDVKPRDTVAFAYCNGLSRDPKSDAEVGGEHSLVVVEKIRQMLDERLSST